MLWRAIMALGTEFGVATHTTVEAQVLQDPRRVAFAVAECFTATMPDEITGPAYIERAGSAWRVVVPLKGQPEANREVQSPPPAEDTLASLDLEVYPNDASLPGDLNPISPFRVNTSAGTIYVVRHGGYFSFRTNGVGRSCVEAATAGAYVP